MTDQHFNDETFEHINFSEKGWKRGEYDNCQFVQCDFSGVDLSNNRFIECEFDECNMSTVPLENTSFQDVVFSGCKLLGLQFSDCNTFLLDMIFRKCQLDMSSFYELKLKGLQMTDCQLKDVDFAGAMLEEARFDNCDLSGALFDQTVLEKADFRTAIGYTIDPDANRIKKAQFSMNGVMGLLGKYDIRIE